jgi:hypothetical protein
VGLLLKIIGRLILVLRPETGFFFVAWEIYSCDVDRRIYRCDKKPDALLTQSTEKDSSDSTSTFVLGGILHCFDSVGRLHFQLVGTNEWYIVEVFASFEEAVLVRPELCRYQRK